MCASLDCSCGSQGWVRTVTGPHQLAELLPRITCRGEKICNVKEEKGWEEGRSTGKSKVGNEEGGGGGISRQQQQHLEYENKIGKRLGRSKVSSFQNKN